MSEPSTLRTYLGDAFFDLDDVLQAAYQGDMHLQGVAEISQGNLLARVICRALGMPKPRAGVSLSVKGRQCEQGFYWLRSFDGHELNSRFVIVGEYLVETTGVLRLYLKARVQDGAIFYSLFRVNLFGIPLPDLLLPMLTAWAKESCGRYAFLLRVELPLIGLLFQHSGKLHPSLGKVTGFPPSRE